MMNTEINPRLLYLLHGAINIVNEKTVSSKDLFVASKVLQAISTEDPVECLKLRQEVFEAGFSKEDWLDLALTANQVSLLDQWPILPIPWLTKTKNQHTGFKTAAEKMLQLNNVGWLKIAFETGLSPTTYLFDSSMPWIQEEFNEKTLFLSKGLTLLSLAIYQNLPKPLRHLMGNSVVQSAREDWANACLLLSNEYCSLSKSLQEKLLAGFDLELLAPDDLVYSSKTNTHKKNKRTKSKKSKDISVLKKWIQLFDIENPVVLDWFKSIPHQKLDDIFKTESPWEWINQEGIFRPSLFPIFDKWENHFKPQNWSENRAFKEISTFIDSKIKPILEKNKSRKIYVSDYLEKELLFFDPDFGKEEDEEFFGDVEDLEVESEQTFMRSSYFLQNPRQSEPLIGWAEWKKCITEAFSLDANYLNSFLVLLCDSKWLNQMTPEAKTLWKQSLSTFQDLAKDTKPSQKSWRERLSLSLSTLPDTLLPTRSTLRL